ncbi:MAG TPA: prolipoprotein diacylglyceryl transferase family protein, partial [Trueperaceae bacterium]|nr:prolipoprotein diacylglyceryl transferase family protein [Trueperaceae bacterium]
VGPHVEPVAPAVEPHRRIHGGIIGVMVAMWLYCRRHGLDMWAYLDVLTPVGALGIIGGRIGNIMNGTDTGGRLTDLGLGFTWPEPGTATLGAFGRFLFGDELWQFAPPACAAVPAGQPCEVHFTQLYGVLVGVILLVIVWAAVRRQTAAAQAVAAQAGLVTAAPAQAASAKTTKAANAKTRASKGGRAGVRRERHFVPNPGYVFWLFAFWYSILRSVLEEPFRDNPLPWQVYLNESAGIGLFTYTQLASIPIILVAAYLMLTAGNKTSEPRVPRTTG